MHVTCTSGRDLPRRLAASSAAKRGVPRCARVPSSWSPTASPSTTAPRPTAPANGGAAPAGWPAPCTPSSSRPPPPGSAGPAAPGRRPALPDIGGLRIRPVAALRGRPARPLRGLRQLHPVAALPRRGRAAGLRPRLVGGVPRRQPAVRRGRRRGRRARARSSGCRTTTCSWSPRLLRELRPDLRIGFFLHVPFPPPELFMQLPRRVELLRGMLGADLVGFQRPQAAHNVAQLATKLLGASATDDQIVRATAGWCAPGRSRSPSTSPRCRRWPPAPTWSARPASSAPTWDSRAGCCSASTGWTTPRASSTG